MLDTMVTVLLMGAERGARVTSHALVIVVLFVSTFHLGETFVHRPVCTAKARNRPRTGGRGVPLRARERAAAENRASPALTKRLAPPALSVPVFSLATINEDGSTNMNIVTYASPVGIEPERLWMVSLYKSTLSYENFLREGWGVLQLLRRKHSPLVPILGQSGGRDTDKSSRSAGEAAFPWDTHQPSCQVLSVPQTVALVPGCGAYMTLRMVSKQPAGDHDAVICRIESVAGPDEDTQASATSESEILETRYLRDAGII